MTARASLLEAVRAAAMLAVLAALILAARAFAPAVPHAQAQVLLALGVVIFGGYLTAHLLERIGLPHVTGYLLAGLVLGPHALAIAPAPAVADLQSASSIALALIGLSAGAELDFGKLRRELKSLVASMATHLLIVLPMGFAALFLLRRFIPFLSGAPTQVALIAALFWGMLTMSRSPSTTMAVISELRPRGPLIDHVLSVVISADLLVVLAFAFAEIWGARFFDPAAASSGDALRDLRVMLTGSLACGCTLGLFIAAWLKLVNRQLLLFLLIVAFGGMQLATYFGFQPLVLFVTAGIVVANLTDQGELLLDLVSAGGQIVFVVFFALAGARIDVGLLAKLWPLALTLWLARGAASVVASKVAAKLARDPPAIGRYAGLSIWSQAGTTIGLAVAASARFPQLGEGFASLAIAVVACNELVGPLLLKWSLDGAGETHKQG